MNKKVKIFVIVLSLILTISILLAAFTSKINSANKGIKIEDPGTLYVGGITNLIISPETGSSITQEEIDKGIIFEDDYIKLVFKSVIENYLLNQKI